MRKRDGGPIEALRSADHPLTLGELAASIALPWRSVGYSLFRLVQSGTVDRLEGGTYTLSAGVRRASEPCQSAGPTVAELFLVVAACEARWRLEDQLKPIEQNSVSEPLHLGI